MAAGKLHLWFEQNMLLDELDASGCSLSNVRQSWWSVQFHIFIQSDFSFFQPISSSHREESKPAYQWTQTKKKKLLKWKEQQVQIFENYLAGTQKSRLSWTHPSNPVSYRKNRELTDYKRQIMIYFNIFPKMVSVCSGVKKKRSPLFNLITRPRILIS